MPTATTRKIDLARRTVVFVLVSVCVLAAVVASPVPRSPQPAAAQSALPPPCTQINLASGIDCLDPITGDPPPEVDESTLAVTEQWINPDPIGLVGLSTSWLYLGLQDSVNDVPRPPSFADEADFLAVQDSQPVGCYYAGPPPTVAGPMTAPACQAGGGEVASYRQTTIPNGQEIDFGSPDELGVTFRPVGWWAVIEHTYEEKGVHTLEYRVYWRQWLWGCRLTPGSFTELLPWPPQLAWGWHCADISDVIIEPDVAGKVAFITENSFEYQVDESRATLR